MLPRVARAFDRLQSAWFRPRTQRTLGALLVVAFLGTLAVIELGRQGALPAAWRAAVPRSHFYAVHLAFTFLLFVEIVGLAFNLAESVANSVGKHFEIFALILLRKSFEQLAFLGEPIDWSQVRPTIGNMLGDALGALLIFVVLGLYYRAQRHTPIVEDLDERSGFVQVKKGIALLLLAAFLGIAGHAAATFVSTGRTYSFFAAAYTVLIFSDVLLVLVSLRYNAEFRVAFRYFGFAVATLLVRLALTAPPLIDAALGLGAATFAWGLTLAYNAFAPVLADGRAPRPAPGRR
ncbi:MAG TPA: hypothetical protein VNI61_10830 [Gemmatimonadales bacterium]|nr:hypothetical protein [Gemmatimonadales bacterium]